MNKVLIFGITGQDGSYLAEILLDAGYKVYGLVRKTATSNTSNIDHLIDSDYFNDQLFIVRGDLLDHSNIFKIISNKVLNKTLIIICEIFKQIYKNILLSYQALILFY